MGLRKGAQKFWGVPPVYEDSGETRRGAAVGDATAALGIVKRIGLGSVRHLHTVYIWVQDTNGRTYVRYGKVDGNGNFVYMLMEFWDEAVL